MPDLEPLADPVRPAAVRGAARQPAGRLTAEEQHDLVSYEDRIATGLRAIAMVGPALEAIRDRRLYRATHPTFQAYCRERWSFTRFYAHRLIEAGHVVANLLPMGNTQTNLLTERQARELAPLDPDAQRVVWTLAEGTAPGGRITAAPSRVAGHGLPGGHGGGGHRCVKHEAAHSAGPQLEAGRGSYIEPWPQRSGACCPGSN